MIAIVTIALLGHTSMFIWIVNRYHSVIVARRRLKVCDAIWCVAMAGIPLSIGAWGLQCTLSGVAIQDSPWFPTIVSYAAVCVVCLAVGAARRIELLRFFAEPNPRLLSNHTDRKSVISQLGFRPTGDALTRWLSRIPGNEVLTLAVHRKRLWLPQLDQALDGITITHLSDLHLTGQLTKDFYHEAMESAMQLKSDMIVITGDIVESRHCLPWIRELFGRLQAPLGVFYVLGNHEKKIRDESSIRHELDSSGLTGLGGRCLTIQARDRDILMAGTEMPWYPPAPDMLSYTAAQQSESPFRILLSHSPDQLPWAQSHEFDLMLAGHTHGGQVRLPGFGPILSPSLNGVRFSAGTFDCPPTLMHVSRGLAGTRPLRYNCPPEIAQLVLCRAPRPASSSDSASANTGSKPTHADSNLLSTCSTDDRSPNSAVK